MTRNLALLAIVVFTVAAIVALYEDAAEPVTGDYFYAITAASTLCEDRKSNHPIRPLAPGP